MRAGAPETRSRQRHFEVGQMFPPPPTHLHCEHGHIALDCFEARLAGCMQTTKQNKTKKTANKAYLHELHSTDDNRRSCNMRQQSAPTAEAQLSRLRPAVLQRLDPIWGLKYDGKRLTGGGKNV